MDTAQGGLGDGVAHVSPIALTLRRIWSEVLDTEDVSLHESFFEQGGKSLQAVQVTIRAGEELGVDLPLDTLFEAPTISAMAAAVEAASPRTAPRPSTATRAGDGLLSRAEETIWTSCFYTPETVPHSTRGYRLTGRLNVAALESAVAEVVRRHETLRTIFPATLGRPRRVVLEPEHTAQPLLVESVGGPPNQRVATAMAGGQRIVQTPFKLEEEAPWRAVLFRLSPQEHLFVFSLHEIICDAWAYDVLMGELSELYSAFSTNRPPSLPDLTTSMSEVVEREARWMSTQEAQSDRDYWARVLDDAPVTVDFPRARRESKQATTRSHKAVPARVVRELRALGSAHRASDFMVYLAAFYALLHRHTGEPDVVVRSMAANRLRVEDESLIGFFASKLPLRSRLQGDPAFTELLAGVRETVSGAVRHARLAPTHEECLLAADPPRGLWATPIAFGLSNSAVSPALGVPLQLPGVRSKLVTHVSPAGRLALEVILAPDGSAEATLIGNLAEADLSSMLRSYVRILEGCADDPDSPISQLERSAPTRATARDGDDDGPRFLGIRLGSRLARLESSLKSHAGVQAASVVWDEDEHSVDAFVVPMGRHLSRRDLDEWVIATMDDWMLPDTYRRVERIPRGPDGAVDRAALVRRPSAPLPDPEEGSARRSAVEARLTAIWQKLLDRSDISRHDNFFHSGGSPLLGAEMVARAHSAGLPLSPAHPVLFPTIAELAVAVEGLMDQVREKQRPPGSGPSGSPGIARDGAGRVVVRLPSPRS